MGTLKEAAGSSVTHLQDNTSSALANGGAVAAATNVFTNASGLNFTASARLTTNGWGATTGIVGTTISLYLVPELDGTNYSTVDTSTPVLPAPCFAGAFVVVTTGTTQYLDLQGISLGPYSYKAYLLNSTGQQLSAGWMLDIWGEVEQY